VKLVPAGTPILTTPAFPVLYFDKESKLDILVADMRALMEREGGIGLAAPQVGVGLRVIIAKDRALANPVITWHSTRCLVAIEGCLSLPGMMRPIMRWRRITVTALDLDTLKDVTIEAKDEMARVLQHEIDHLNGILITHRNMWNMNVEVKA
jgi:peptide deformylase